MKLLKLIENHYDIILILISISGWLFSLYKDRKMHILNKKAEAYEKVLYTVYSLERVAAIGQLNRSEYNTSNAEILSIDLYGNDVVVSDLNKTLDIVVKLNNAYKTDNPISDLENDFFVKYSVLSKSMRKDLGYKKMDNDPTTLSDIEFID